MARGKKYVSSKVTILSKEERPFSVPENWFWTDIDSINQYSGSPVDPMKQPDTVFELYSVPSSADDYPEILAGSEIGSSKQSVIKNDILLCKEFCGFRSSSKFCDMVTIIYQLLELCCICFNQTYVSLGKE